LLVPMNEAISPVPLAASPIEVVLFVQLNTSPGVCEYLTCTYNRFTVPTHGSPKVELLAGMVTLFWPNANAETTATLFAALHEPIVKLPQLPLGVP